MSRISVLLSNLFERTVTIDIAKIARFCSYICVKYAMRIEVGRVYSKVWKIISNRLHAPCGGGQTELQPGIHFNFYSVF